MNLPAGRLVRSRVVPDAADLLAAALDRSFTGYAALEPAEAVLLDDGDAAAVAFVDGAPVGALHAGTGREGPAALADLAGPGPYSVELRATDAAALAPLRTDERSLAPGTAAERLAGDPDLAQRARDVAGVEAPAATTAPDSGEARDRGGDAVAAFLENEERIERLRERAREQARDRAVDWGLEDQLVDRD
jgi:hypothetical protein